MIRHIRQVLAIGMVMFAAGVPGVCQEVVWDASMGGVYNEGGNSGLQTSDGGYLIIGSTFSFGAGKFDIYLIKISPLGSTAWTRTYGGIDTEYGYDIKETDDGGYVIIGSTRSFGNGGKDVYLVKIDSLGDPQWSRTYGGAGNDEGRAIIPTADRGFMICGSTDSYGAGYSDFYLIRTDSSGDTTWTRTFGGSGGEAGYGISRTADGGYVAVGSTGSFGEGYSSVYVVRVDSLGDSLWADAYGGSSADIGYAVTNCVDGGYLIAGGTASFGAGYTDAYLLKTDSLGIVEWQKAFGGAKDDRAYSICRSLDGGYLLTGTSESFGAGKLDIYMIKTTPSGDTLWTATFGGSNSDYGRMVFQEQGRNYILIGDSYSFSSGGSDVYVIKIRGETTPVNDVDFDCLPRGFELGQNYPNPFNLTTTIEYTLPRHSKVEISVYNILGQVVRQWRIDFKRAGTHSLQWDGTEDCGAAVATGIYFCRMIAGDFVETRKMVLVK
jgi:hypothetical protein